MKFNGTNWVVVGTAGFSAGGAYSTSLAFDVSGTPYVAYRDNGNGGKATVMKFDGTNWVNVVSAGFSNSAAYLTSLAINDNGMLYVAFQDNSSSIYRKATVMQSDGVSAWTVSGTAGFSAGQVAEISLAVQGTGLPYISYRDNGNGGKTTVMQLVKTADPVITNNTGLTLNEGATVTIDSSALLTTDTDTEPGSLTYTVTTPPYYGEIQKSGILVSSFTQDDINNGLITYVHDGSENFSVWFAFIVSDGTFQSTVQQFTLTVTPVNDAPVIVNNNGLTLNPGISTATIDTSFLSASDAESDAITFIITTLPTNGTLQNNGTDIALNGTFTQTDLNNSLISYTHDGSSTISDNFTFSITDGTDSLSNQVFNITIIDKAWEVLGSKGFSAGSATFTSMKIDANGLPYVAYMDGGNSSKATVMKFDGSNWTNVGSAGFTTGAAYNISFAMDANGTPYVAFKDGTNSYKVSVMKYDGTNWAYVGSAGFAPKPWTGTSLAIAPNGTPYVAFKGAGYYDGGTVMKYNGSSWETVGGATFLTGQADGIALAIDTSGTPYVAYQDGGTSNAATVKKFNGTSWEIVGAAKFTAGKAGNINLAFDKNNTAYISYYGPYIDADNNAKASVMKYDGTNWVNVGTTDFSAGSAGYMSLALGNDGTPYVAYQDAGNSYKATVMKFDGTNWNPVGGVGISEGSARSVTFAINDDGALFVAYADGANNSKATVLQRGWIAPNQVPSIAANTGLTINEGATATIDNTKLKATDADSDDGALLFTITTATTNGEVQLSGTSATTFTQADIDSGNVTYVHNGDETTSDSFTFSLSDGTAELSGQTFSITVTPVNDAPVVAGIPNITFPEDSTYTIDLDDYASDTDNALSELNWSVASVTTPPAGSIVKSGKSSSYLFIVSSKNITSANKTKTSKKGKQNKSKLQSEEAGGELGAQKADSDSIMIMIDSSTHIATFTATLNYNIADVPFVFTATDTSNASGSDTTTVTVTPVNDSTIIAVNAGLTLDEGATAVIDNTILKAADVDTDNGALVFTITTATTNGEVQLSGTSATTFTQADIDSGNVTYVHNGGETTSDSFTFSLSDGTAELSGQTFSITVTPVNDAPVVAGIPNITFPEDSTYTIDLDDYASDADNALSELNWSVASVTTPPAGSIVKSGKSSSYLFIVSSKNITSANETKTSKKGKQNRSKLQSEEAGGELGTQKADSDSIMIMIDSSTHIATFTATLNYNIADVPFVFTATDTSNASGSDTTTVTVTPVNDSTIIAVNAGLTLDEGATAVIDNTILKASDVDTDNGALVFTITTATTNGEVQLSGTSASSFTQADIDSGKVTYVHNGGETTSDEFTFSLTDGFDTIFGQTFTITITSVNDIPVNTVAPVISGTAMEEHELSVDNGSWTDADSDSLSYTYQWYSDNDSLDYNGTAITDAVNSTYMLTSNEVGNYVYAEITADDGNGGIVVANSEYTLEVELLVSVDEKIIPTKYSLSQNYPNPFNPSTNFKYGLKEASEVVFEVYNIQGRKVKSLVNERQSAGYHTIRVDMSDLASGVYLYRLRAGNFVKSMKMILLK